MRDTAGVAGLNPAISEHVIMPCLTMLLHTIGASPAGPVPPVAAAAASAGAAGRIGSTSTGTAAGRTPGTAAGNGSAATHGPGPTAEVQSAAGSTGMSSMTSQATLSTGL